MRPRPHLYCWQCGGGGWGQLDSTPLLTNFTLVTSLWQRQRPKTLSVWSSSPYCVHYRTNWGANPYAGRKDFSQLPTLFCLQLLPPRPITTVQLPHRYSSATRPLTLTLTHYSCLCRSQTVMSQESLSAKESFKRSYIKEGPAILTSVSILKVH